MDAALGGSWTQICSIIMVNTKAVGQLHFLLILPQKQKKLDSVFVC